MHSAPFGQKRALALAVLVWAAAALPLDVQGQCLPSDGPVGQVKVTAPPNFTQAQPFRTNRSQINIGFEHDGATGSYFINSAGADVNGSTFLPLPTDKTGNVAAGFNTDGIKQVGVILLQQRCNIVVDSRQSPSSGGAQAFIQFDTKPPVITIQSVTLGPNPPNSPIPFNNQVFTTNVDQAVVIGSVIDPDNGSPAQDIKVTIKNLANNTNTTAQVDQQTGQFTANLALSGIADGSIDIEITAEDKMTDTQATPNKSDPTTIRFVRDKIAPTVQQLEIIRFDNDAARREVLDPGAKSFVGQEIVLLRVTMSEKMGSPPQVNVTQNAGSKIPATILAQQTVNDTVFVYQYNTIPVEAQNGPAKVEITGQFQPAPATNFGFDLANNPIVANDPKATFNQAFSVDTVSPDLNRLATPPPPGQFASQPKDGEVLGRDAFPQVIQVFVDDFNTSGATDQSKNFASGVDFSSVSNAATVPQSGGLTISLRGPAGDIPGTPSVSPPTGLFLNLPDFTGSANNNNNFTDRDFDGKKEPLDGAYVITVNLIDKVGNRSTKSINFRVDTLPVSSESIAVNVAGCIRLQTGEFPPIIVSSRDPDFNVTSTNVEFFSQIGGPNSVPVKFDADQPNRAAPTTPGTSATITLSNVRKPGQSLGGDQFPNPNPPPPTEFVPPGVIDPRTGANDGTYFVRVTPRDLAGNSGTLSTTSGRRQAFLDFPVQIDNTDPFVERTFPLVDRAVSGPLNFLEAVIIDPVATNGNAGCGIDVNASQLVARLDLAYQPNRVDKSFLDAGGQNGVGKLRGAIKFTHVPNSTDPTRNDFNPRDDRFRVALEFTDPVSGRARSLATDGSMDGIYSIAVNPVDRAGNSLDTNPLSPTRIGQYFGLKRDPESTIDLSQFFFLYDNIPPKIEIDNFPDGVLLQGGPGRLATKAKAAPAPVTESASPLIGTSGVTEGAVIGARPFRITGFVSDLSAQLGAAVGGANDVHRGGADVDRVEYFLEVVDLQGPIPPVPPTEQKPGEVTPGRNNPVIPITRAVLDAVQIPANDPTRTTSVPLDTTFASTIRERRKFTIDDVLPTDDRLLKPTADDQFYRFTIRAIDKAGNVTTIQRRVTIDIDDVKPPRLTSPLDNIFSRSQVVQFRWANAPGIRKYKFKLTFPPSSNIKPVEKILEKSAEDVNNADKNVVQFTLPVEGLYKWSVASFDQVGNEGVPSGEFRITVDFTAPSIRGDKATVTGDVQPASRTGVVGIGNFNVRLEFHEALKNAPRVSWQPASPSTGATELTTIAFTGSVVEYQGQIPRDADPRVFDGRASLIVFNVVDLAGNPINGQNEVTIDGFEVDTGPAFQARFFISPITPGELTVVLLASEELSDPPRFTELAGLAQINNQAFRIAGNPRAFYSTFKLNNPTVDQIARMTATGSDLDGNASRRDIRLTVTKLRRTTTSRLVAAESDFEIEVPAGAVRQDVAAYVFPTHEVAATPELQALAKTQSTTAMTTEKPLPGSGLVDLGGLPDVQPEGLVFDQPAVVRAGAAPAPRGISPGQIGIYQRQAGRWRLVGGRRVGKQIVGSLGQLAPLRWMADTAAPMIEEMNVSDGERLDSGRPTIQAKVTDAGSGVAIEGIALALDGETVPSFQYDESSGLLSYTPSRELAPGPHAIEIAARDRAGNATAPRKVGLVAPDQFGFRSPVLAVPNPVRGLTASLAADLTQPAATASLRLEIYDVNGRRIRLIEQPGPFAAARALLTWDVAGADGDPAANGVYLFRVKALSVTGSKAQSTGKIAVLR